MRSAIGVPVVRPSNTPERISTASDSRRCVTWRDVPGRRRSSSRWMSVAGELHSGRAAVDDAADRRAVRFAERGDAEKRAECIAGHRCQVQREGAIECSTRVAEGWRGCGCVRQSGDARRAFCPSGATRCRASRRAVRRGADRRGRVRRIRRADIPRRANRAVGKIRPARARDAGGLRAQPEARLGLVRDAARHGRSRGAECRARGARAGSSGAFRNSRS